MNHKKVVIHTDGACEGNPGPGGWAAILRHGALAKELSGAEPGIEFLAVDEGYFEPQRVVGLRAAVAADGGPLDGLETGEVGQARQVLLHLLLDLR